MAKHKRYLAKTFKGNRVWVSFRRPVNNDRQGLRIRKTHHGGVESLEERHLMANDPLPAAQVSTHHSDAAAVDFYRPPHVFQSTATHQLSAPSASAPLDIALGYFRSRAADFGLHTDDLAYFRVTDQYVSQHTGVTHIYLRQQHNGLDVIHADINVSIGADGSVLTGGEFVCDRVGSCCSRIVVGRTGLVGGS